MELRFTGFDGLMITGHAPSPVMLWVADGDVEIRDASAVWSCGTFETHDRLREETAPRAQVACIGPAGEHCVPLTGVMTGGQAHNRAAGRGGIEALMGARNLKAIAVRGSQRPAYFDREPHRGARLDPGRETDPGPIGGLGLVKPCPGLSWPQDLDHGALLAVPRDLWNA